MKSLKESEFMKRVIAFVLLGWWMEVLALMLVLGVCTMCYLKLLGVKLIPVLDGIGHRINKMTGVHGSADR